MSGVSLRGFTVAFSRLAGISASGLAGVALQNLTVTGHGRIGVSMSGANSSLVASIVSGTGCGGVTVTGGDTAALVPGGMAVSGCSVAGFARLMRAYAPGIGWAGVGTAVTGTSVSGAPHAGILGGGVWGRFTDNALSDLCWEVSDAGGFYVGRSWVQRGLQLARNSFTRIRNAEGIALGSPQVQALYLDDQFSGAAVVNNSFADAQAGILVGGGRENTVSGNTFVAVDIPVSYDNRGMTWQAGYCAWNASYTGLLPAQLFAVNYAQAPYATAFPTLPGTLSNRLCVPVGNAFTGNRFCNSTSANGFLNIPQSAAAGWGDVFSDNVAFAC